MKCKIIVEDIGLGGVDSAEESINSFLADEAVQEIIEIVDLTRSYKGITFLIFYR